jgi:hypothetical protein
MNNLKRQIVELNKTIKNGYDHTSWILYTLTGGTLISYALKGFGLAAILPAAAVPSVSIGVFYLVGRAHKEERAKR